MPFDTDNRTREELCEKIDSLYCEVSDLSTKLESAESESDRYEKSADELEQERDTFLEEVAVLESNTEFADWRERVSKLLDGNEALPNYSQRGGYTESAADLYARIVALHYSQGVVS